MIGPYLEILRTPRVPRLLLSMIAYGVTSASIVTALVFWAHDLYGSFSEAGTVVAAWVAGIALSGPVRGRWLDVNGPREALPRLALTSAASAGVLIAAGEWGAPPWLAALPAFAFGALSPPVGSVMRNLWKPLLAGRGSGDTPFALLTMAYETTLMTGPLLAALLIALASPLAALVTGLFGTCVAAFAFARSPGVDAAPLNTVEGRAPLELLAGRGFRTLLLTVVAYGLVFGQLEDIALPAFATEEGSRAAAGILLAAIAVGIVIGGFVWGLRARRTGRIGEILPWLCMLSVAGFVPAFAAPSIPVMAVFMVVAGLCIAPVTALQFALIDELVPAGSGTEAMGWFLGISNLGSALGVLIAGWLVDHHGTAAALAAVPVTAALAVVISFAGRAALTPSLERS